jgi:O-antigen ligase
MELGKAQPTATGIGRIRPAVLPRLRAVPWRLVAFGTLGAATMLNRYTLTVAGLHAKLEHLAILALLAAFVVYALRSGWRPCGRALLWLAPYLGGTALASLLNAPERLTALRLTGLVTLVALGALLVYWCTDTPARFRAAVRILIGFAGVEAALAFAGLVAAWFNSPLGVQPGRGEILVPFGTMWEPNVLGGYLAAGAILTLAALVMAPMARRGIGLAALFTLILAALGLSLSRGAWAGFLAGVIVIACGSWLLARRSNVPWPALAPRWPLALGAALAAALFLVAVAPALFPMTTKGLFNRVNVAAYTPQADPSLLIRADMASQAAAEFGAHPLIGHGAGSFGINHFDEQGRPGWISNLELHVLYDSGIVGLVALFGGLAVSGWAAWRSLRHGDPAHRPAIMGVLGAVVVLLVAYQATEASWLGYTWIYLGLLARAGTLAPTPER